MTIAVTMVHGDVDEAVQALIEYLDEDDWRLYDTEFRTRVTTSRVRAGSPSPVPPPAG